MALKFGLIVPQGWRMDLVGIADPIDAYETMTDVAREAELLGYNSIWLYDHFHTTPNPTQEITFECWTSMAALARDTKRIRLGQMVTCNSYRNPALLAKMASTIDILSHGRLTLGIGAGWYEQEYKAFGYDYPTTPIRLSQLEEAVQVILAMWTKEEAVFEGKYYQVKGAINQPKGLQKPHIPLLIGGSGEKVTLKLVARYGDACNISNLETDFTTLNHKLSILKKHCENIGRDYRSISPTILLNCVIGETDKEALSKLGPWIRNAPLDYLRERALIGTPDMILQRLFMYEKMGIQEIIMYMPDAAKLDSVRLFAHECMQAFVSNRVNESSASLGLDSRRSESQEA